MSDLHEAAKTKFDLVVIGGGCVGTAVAMFAARAGLKTALVERNDFGSGTTAASTELIHGGLQYLFRLQLGIVRKSNQYARRIHRSATHLCRPVPIVIPYYRGGRYPFAALRAVMRVYEWYNRRYKHAPPTVPLTAEEIIRQVPGIRREGLTGGLKYYEWRIDAARLCLTNARLAARHGALVQNHAEVVGLEQQSDGRYGVTIQDERTAQRVTLDTRLVVNATGPWTDELCRMAGLAEPPRIRPTRGAHIFLPKVAEVGLLLEFVDGRHGVALPREHLTMVGTTDDDYYGPLDDMQATGDEAAYLLQGVERLLPAISADDILDTKVGVRPTIYQYGKTEDKVSRDHRVEDHAPSQRPGLISVYGGKLATHTLMAEDVLGIVGQRLQRPLDVPEDYRLPGAPDEDFETYRHRAAAAAAEKYDVDASAAETLVRRYGTEHEAVLELIGERPELSENLCRCRHDGRPIHYVLAAEVHYGVRHEWAHSVDDIRRRTGLGLGECRRNGCLEAAQSILRTIACRGTDSVAGRAGEGAPTPSSSTTARD